MNTPKKHILSLALLAVVSGVAISQLSTTSVSAQTVDPQSLVSQQPASQGPGQVAPVSVPPSPGAPPAIPATTPPITGPSTGGPSMSQPNLAGPQMPSSGGNPSVVPFQQLPTDPEVLRLQQEAEAHSQRIVQMTSSSADESAILREVARYQARLSLLNVASKVETTQQQMASSRAKFQVEQAKTLGELSAVQQPAPVAGPGGVGPGQGGAQGGPMSSAPEIEQPPYTLVGISSFGDKTLAQISGPSGAQSVESGTMLGEGYRVSRISSNSVVLTHKGRRHTLYLSPMPSGSAAAAGSGGSLNTK